MDAPSSKNEITTLLQRPDLLKIVVEALTETIRRYTQVDVHSEKPYLKEVGEKTEIAIAGIVRFESPAFTLELSLGFSRELFSVIYESMFNERGKEISEETQDLAGEILNIAFGVMDPRFRELGYSLRASFPKIYSGRKLATWLIGVEARALVVPFDAAGKKFYVEMYAANSLSREWQFDPDGSNVA